MLPADIFHRYLDLRGKDNIFICGSDVHGTPLALEALERDIPVEEFVETQHKKVEKILNSFELDFSVWGHTNSDHNRKQTHDMFVELYCKGYITENKQKMAYSDTDDRFLPDRYVEGDCPECGEIARGDQCDECGTLLEPEELIEPYSTISGATDIEFKETTHLFLDLPQFKDRLKTWLENSEPQPVPDSSYKEVMNAIEETEERAITRDIDWGFNIPVERVNNRIEEENLDIEKLEKEKYSNKVLYVWFDAPIGYIAFTRQLFNDEDDWKDYWINDESDVYYSIGKDNTIFHSVIWPSILMGSSTEEEEYNLPHYEFIQQYLMAEDAQFSKSKGTGLGTADALELCPPDYWRFYLARNIPSSHDTKFSFEDFEKEINNVLNDTVGNFVNRTLSLTEKWFDNQVPVEDLREEDNKILNQAEILVEEYIEAFENHDLKKGLEKSIELARLGDQYLSNEEPWKNEEVQEPVINVCIRLIRGLSATLYPYTPDTSQRISEMLNVDLHTEEGIDELLDPFIGELEPKHELGERKILFEKVDGDKLMEKTNQESEDEAEQNSSKKNLVSFEEFQEISLKVGKIKNVEEHPNADLLYLVQLDLGGRELQTCAGLKKHYKDDELEGLKVAVFENLEPSNLRGEKSECMMLAAEDDKQVELITFENVEVGSEIN